MLTRQIMLNLSVLDLLERDVGHEIRDKGTGTGEIGFKKCNNIA